MLQRMNEFQFVVVDSLALLLPILCLGILFLRNKKETPSFRFPSLKGLASIPTSLRQRYREPILHVLLITFICAIGIAASRPQLIVRTDIQASARNLILAVDVSKSMATRDIVSPDGPILRIDAVRDAIRSFLTKRSEDRVGLIVFGSDVFLKTPLTLDHDTLLEAVSELQIGMAGEKTSIGDAIAQSLKRIKDLPARTRSIILFTDGLNTAGNIDPIRAAQMAAKLGVRIFTVGIGQSNQRTQAFDEKNEKTEEFDEYVLKEISAISGGIYSNAASLLEVQKVQQRIGEIEKESRVVPNKPVLIEFFFPLTVIALFSFTLLLILSTSYFRKLP